MSGTGWTTRRLLALVALLGLALGLGWPAAQVLREGGRHHHVYIKLGADQPPQLSWAFARSAFWTRYAKALSGRSWRGQAHCVMDGGRIAEACELEDPEMREARGQGHFDLWPGRSQWIEYERLWSLDPRTRGIPAMRRPMAYRED